MTTPDPSRMPAAPPSLFGTPAERPATGHGDVAAAENLRMLAGLGTGEANGQAARSRRGWIAGMLSGIVAIGVGGLLWLKRDVAPVRIARPIAAAAPAEPMSSREAARPGGVPVDRAAPTVAAPESPVAGSVPALAAAATIERIDPGAGPAVDTAQAATSVSSTPTRTGPAGGRLAAIAAPKPVARRAAPAHRSENPAPVATAARAPNPDADVELVTAMVAHLGGEAPRSRPQPAAPALQPATIEKLVRSCRQVATADRTSCRRQVCEGHWGRTPSCPARTGPAGGPARR